MSYDDLIAEFSAPSGKAAAKPVDPYADLIAEFSSAPVMSFDDAPMEIAPDDVARAVSDVPTAPGDKAVEYLRGKFDKSRLAEMARTAPSLSQKAIGGVEAALSTATGLTTGALGMVAGTAKGLLQEGISLDPAEQAQRARRVEESAMQGAQAGTYEPRTETGQRYTQAVGEAVAPLVAATPLMSEISGAMQVAGNVAKIPKLPARESDSQPRPTPGTMGSGGSAGTDIATIRRGKAAELLPEEAQLTKGQASRDWEQLRFENEVAKNPTIGEPIRQRYAEQHASVKQRLDGWIDETGAISADEMSAGAIIDDAIKAKLAKDKARVRTLYKEAEKTGETQAPVSLKPLIDTLNESVSAESTAPVLSAAKKELMRLGGASVDDTGRLVESGQLSLSAAEQLRKFVNKTTGNDPTNIKFSGDVKRAIDAATEGAGGEFYAKARKARSAMARQYEDRAIVSDIIGNKRGSADRRVALEGITNRLLFSSSVDDLKFAGSLIKRADPEAWREVQGAAVRYIQSEATKGVSTDAYGNPVISAGALVKAVEKLDANGKLDYLFGKVNAEKVRTIGDVAKTMFTSPPGTVNTSNTASVLLAALDMAMSSTSGVPMPVMSGLKMLMTNIKDRKLKARVADALGQKQTGGF